MIVVYLRHVSTGIRTPVLEMDAALDECTCTLACIPEGIGEEQECRLQDRTRREEISFKDAMGKAIREVAAEIQKDPMEVMSSPRLNKFTIVLEAK